MGVPLSPQALAARRARMRAKAAAAALAALRRRAQRQAREPRFGGLTIEDRRVIAAIEGTA